ncbi:hypothetical protein KJZ63_04945 [Patescibacteria group bacterium]|nr:hypothetical protein [Patescibacteria group bacterium]
MQTSQEISSTAQKFLEIHDIANDLLILKDGATALIITVSAMNFGLLAEEEQDAIIYSYAGLLNSLNYPIQIVIKSQTKDVTSYLKLLDQELEVATSHTKREWIKKYRSFVANLIRERNVLDKKFYVVIPATALEMGLLPPSTVIPGVQQPDLSTVERSVILEKAREILEPKRDHLMAQFGRIGLNARQLTTQEIIQLFYLSYNPEAAEGQQITDTNSYTTPLVRASVIKGGNMIDSTQMSGAINNGANLVAPTNSPAALSTNNLATPTTASEVAAPTPVVTTPTVAAAPEVSQVISTAPTTPAMPPTMAAPSPMSMPATTPAPVSVSTMPTSVTSAPISTPMPIPSSEAIQGNVGAVSMPNTTPVSTLNSSSDSLNINDMQNVINSAAQEVGPSSTNTPGMSQASQPMTDLTSPNLPKPSLPNIGVTPSVSEENPTA